MREILCENQQSLGPGDGGGAEFDSNIDWEVSRAAADSIAGAVRDFVYGRRELDEPRYLPVVVDPESTSDDETREESHRIHNLNHRTYYEAVLPELEARGVRIRRGNEDVARVGDTPRGFDFTQHPTVDDWRGPILITIAHRDERGSAEGFEAVIANSADVQAVFNSFAEKYGIPTKRISLT